MDGSGEEGKALPPDGAAREGAPPPPAAPSIRPNAGPPDEASAVGVTTDPLRGALAALADGFGVLEAVEPVPGVVDLIWTHANPALREFLGQPDPVGRALVSDHADGTDRAGVGEPRDEAAPAMLAARTSPRPTERVVARRGRRLLVTAAGFGGAPPSHPHTHVAVTVREAPSDQRADRLRGALEHASDAIALFDADGRLVDHTGKLREMVPEIADMVGAGTTFRELLRRLVGRPVDETPTIPPRVDVASWLERRLERRDGRAAQLAYQSASGRWLLAKAWRTPDGGIVSVTTDITTFKAQEEALRESEAQARSARSEAERANRAKSEFLAHMSHELRTPLNAIIGFAELMSLRAFGPLGSVRYDRYAQDILDSGRHLLELVDDTLRLSRIEAGRHELVEEMVDVAEEVAATVRRHDEAVRRKRLALTTDASRSLPPLIADRRALRDMLEHLLTNAMKFTGEEGRIVITASPTPDGGLGIMVADTGIGIAADDIPRALEPFGRTEMTARHGIDGTGLGLPIVKRLIEMHGGQLSLESEPGVGTTVILTFPASRVIDPGALPFFLGPGGAAS